MSTPSSRGDVLVVTKGHGLELMCLISHCKSHLAQAVLSFGKDPCNTQESAVDKSFAMASAIVLSLVLGACASNPTNTQIGTATGAVVGGLVGSALTGSAAGTVVGAGAGAVVGYGVGRRMK